MIHATTTSEAQIKAEALCEMAKYLSPESLKILASKASKKGINEKIKQFKNFI